MKLVPTFRRSHSLAATPFCDLRKAKGTRRSTIPVPLFDLKSPKRKRHLGCGDFRSAVLALLPRALTAFLLTMVAAISPARAQTTLDKVTFGTNWVAEAEHGGFFQALADGTYQRYGLDVTIVPGGPNENNRMLLITGRLDFFMAANTLMSFDAVANNVPVVTVAAIFQKDPQVLLTHPESKITKLEELKPLTLFVSKEGISSYFQWLKSEYGFSEDRVRPYTFNPQPFLVDKHSAMQGYVTSEPYAIEKAAGFKPGIILLADYGFNTYSTLIETRRDLIDKKPDLVQRFVSASLIGWHNYLYGNNAAANAMIRKLNPEMTDELIAYSIARMKEYGIVDSGDSLRDGIGAMNDARMASFFDKMVRAHVVRSDIDYRKSYTLRFVNKGVGLDLRPRN
jgi:NitT/TauT family transport system substrate-binding protein